MANIIIHLATASAVLIGGGSSAGWAQVVKVQHSVPYEVRDGIRTTVPGRSGGDRSRGG